MCNRLAIVRLPPTMPPTCVRESFQPPKTEIVAFSMCYHQALKEAIRRIVEPQ
jgi:hypothetical protein